MSFFARPDLSDVQFKQLSGSTLTLSGQTRIANMTGLSISDGMNYVPIIVTGGTNYDVLTYRNGQITLEPSTGSGGVYSGASPTTCTVGGLLSGTAIAGCSLSLILEKILVPDAPPTSSISFISGSLSRQFGDTSGIGTANLCWSVVKNTNTICAIGVNSGGTGTYISVTPIGGSQNGISKYTYPTSCACPASAIVSTSALFGVCAQSVSGETTISTISITWRDRKYWGGNGTNYICSSSGTTNTAINTLCCSELSSTGTKCFCNFCIGSNNFFYYAYPKIFGLPQQITVNGLPNNSWGCCALGTLGTFRRCNTNGYCQDFYLIRSDNQISGSFNINITTVI